MDLSDFAAALDSPLCESMAPELFAMKPKVTKTFAKYQHGCQPCKKARRDQEYALLQIELMNIINQDTALEAVMPTLVRTGKKP